MPEDERDIKITLEMIFPKSVAQHVDQARDILETLMANAIVVNQGQPNEERGGFTIERHGHRIGQECTVIGQWIVGIGRVI